MNFGLDSGRQIEIQQKKTGVTGAICVFLVFVVVYFFYALVWSVNSSSIVNSDFYKSHLSAKNFIQGKSIYWQLPSSHGSSAPCFREGIRTLEMEVKNRKDLTADDINTCLHPNLNPPVFTAFVLPIAELSYSSAWQAWTALSLGCAFLAVCVLLLELKQERRRPGIVTLISLFVVFFAYSPVFANYLLGQVAFFLFLILVMSWWLLRRGFLGAAGAALGLAMSLKPFIGVFLIFLVVGRFWRTLFSAIIFSAWLALIGVFLFGVDSYLDYIKIAREVTWISSNWNASLSGFFYRLMGGSCNIQVDCEKDYAPMLALAGSVLVIFISSWRVRLASHEPNKFKADAMFSVAIPSMLLVSPLGWIYYFPLLAITVGIVWANQSDRSRLGHQRLLVILGVVMSFFPMPMEPIWVARENIKIFWDSIWYTYSLLVLFGVSVCLFPAREGLHK